MSAHQTITVREKSVAAIASSFLAATFAITGCATLIEGTGREVSFTSNVPGADVYVNGRLVGKTPVVAKVGHGLDKQVEARMPGYASDTGVLTTSFCGYTLLGYVLMVVDAISGAMFTLDDTSVYFELTPLSGETGPVKTTSVQPPLRMDAD